MAQKKTTKKRNQNVGIQRKKYVIVSVIVLGVLAILWAGWWLVFKHNVYSPNKTQVKVGIQAALNDASFQGKMAYSDLTDTGCDDRNSVGLARYVHCDFLAQRYFVDSGDLLSHLRDADKVLSKYGWQRDPSADAETYDAVFSGASRHQLRYSKNSQSLMLVFYKDQALSNIPNGNELLAEGKIAPLNKDQFIYGVWTNTSYWSCRSDTLFEICPLPPSTPKND